MSGPIPIHSRFVKPRKYALSQTRTAKFVWKHLSQNGSYLIADAVGAGKSYVALSLAFGLWKSKRKGRLFRILILAGPSELNHAWIQKLVGVPVSQENRIESFAQRPGKQSFCDLYLQPIMKQKMPETTIYHLRHKHDTYRLKERIKEARQENNQARLMLAPNRSGAASRVEILVTSPSWAKQVLISGRRGVWRRWLKNVNVVIADEVFGAKNEHTVYGRILRPRYPDNKRHLWRKGRRPWLIGLSATLLSRDIMDTKSVLRLCLDWRADLNRSERLMAQIDSNLNNFSREIRTGLRLQSQQRRLESAGKYRIYKSELERLLPKVIVRTLSRRSRAYAFWPGGHENNELFHYTRKHKDLRTIQFPLDRNMDSMTELLQDYFSQVPQVDKGLAWFMTPRFHHQSTNEEIQSSWTAITESFPRNEELKSNGKMHPKLASLRVWIKAYYQECENSWLERHMSEEFRFKLLVYVYHVKTAVDLNPRSRTPNTEKAIGHLVRHELRRLMLKTCSTIARKNKDLFDKGRLHFPKAPLQKILQDHGWTIERMISQDLTLLLALCLNIHKGTSRKNKLSRANTTLAGSEIDRSYSLYRRILGTHPRIRHLIFRRLQYGNVVAYEMRLKQERVHLPITPTMALLDPEALHLPSSELEAFKKTVLPRITGELVSAQTGFGRNKGEKRGEQRSALRQITSVLENTISQSKWWLRSIEKFNHAPAKALARLQERGRKKHQTPWEIAVLTGGDAHSRDYMADRFRSPGNPFVLVLTNVCTVGIDLHTFCWDVLHYTPGRTPHEAEQKTGRIDRPRARDAIRKLDISKGKGMQHIRVHYLIWPFTYDERILKRLNLRAQLSERLLGSRHRKALGNIADDVLQKNAANYKPLNLQPA